MRNARTVVRKFHPDAVTGKAASTDTDPAMHASLPPALLDGLLRIDNQIEHRLL